jgi:two-component system, OmpR family, sensor histidine kinase VicK
LGPLPLEKTQIEVIESSSKAKVLYLDILKATTKEIMLIVPTVNAFLRQEKIGAFQLARKAAESRNVKVRILMPSHKLSEQATNNLNQHPDEHINVRYLEQVPGTEATILVIDRKVSLVMEIRDDSKSSFDEAIGLSTYSNSRAGVLSYVSIFENLWKQTELYEKEKQTNEQLASVIEVLKIHDKSREEFINVAAHELRTPIQPILSLAEFIHSQITDDKGNHNNDNKMKKYLEPLNVIIRNAKRLQQLSEAVLDITKIESKTLRLNKESFDLNDVIINSLDNMILSSEFTNSPVQLSYQPQTVFLEADKGRISQVISNLLSNAFKFTNKDCGTIFINLNIKNEDRGNNIDAEETSDSPRCVMVSITDNGTGIDPEIFPRLFDKFVSKSYHGTGLGLFISKSIVEAHGGKIWAQNNNNNNGRNGATLYFTLPVLEKEKVA